MNGVRNCTCGANLSLLQYPCLPDCASHGNRPEIDRNTDVDAFIHLITPEDWEIIDSLHCTWRSRPGQGKPTQRPLARWLDTANL